MNLENNLVLFHFLCRQLGTFTPNELRILLKDVQPGRRPDMHSHFFGLLHSDTRLTMPLSTLMQHDLHVLECQDKVAQTRKGFTLTYFQYLSALFADIYLKRYSNDKVSLLLELEAYRTQHYSQLPQYQGENLHKLAFYMATGSGKTLLLHINLLQFRSYRPFTPKNIILLAPTSTLAEQHIAELRASGLDAIYGLESTLKTEAIQVLEMSKLYVPGKGRHIRGGASIPTIQFQGPNLLLIDEGHKGTTSTSDTKTERAWRDIRDTLAQAEGQQGFTLEYSATFRQVTEKNSTLFNDYARCIGFDYSYAHFHSDQYGKEYRVFNLPQHDQMYGQTLLLGGLLVNYAQHHFFHQDHHSLHPYNLEQPLLVFVGSQVTGGHADVQDVILFLDHVLREPTETIEQIRDLLQGQSELPALEGRDPFTPILHILKATGMTAEEIYDNLCQQIFYGKGRLRLHMLRQSEGEIGIRTTNSPSDCYFGVVNVGDARRFLKLLAKSNDTLIGDDDYITLSLFDAINKPNSTINILVGSKKFIEGWSSWRVSVMGLLRVGANAGAQVLQLFGRGVRLKGKNFCLKRSAIATTQGTYPASLGLLETLFIFGIKADYLNKFLSNLRKATDIEIPFYMPLELDVDTKKIDTAGLQVLEPDPSFAFPDHVLTFMPNGMRLHRDLSPALVVTGEKTTQGKATYRSHSLASLDKNIIPFEKIYQEALQYKYAKRWYNLYLSRDSLHAYLSSDTITIAAPDDFFTPMHPHEHRMFKQVLVQLVQDGLNKFMTHQEKHLESQHLRTTLLDSTHENFPRSVQGIFSYELAVPPHLVQDVKDIIQDSQKRLQQDFHAPLPRMFVDNHLYNPLLLEEAINGKSVVKSTPQSLVESEQRFLADIKYTWTTLSTQSDWQDYHLYLLRNLPKKGIGFFKTAGFYPDFLLWLKKDQQQVLVFVDPKGLTHWNEEKVVLLAEIHQLFISGKVHLPLLAYIVTPTQPQDIAIANIANEDVPDFLAKRNVLFQSNPDYMQTILHATKTLLP